MAKINNTEALRRLAREHPGWTYKQFAEATGQSINTVRGIMHRIGMTNKKRVYLRVKKEPEVMARVPNDFVFFASKATSYRTGYTKLI